MGWRGSNLVTNKMAAAVGGNGQKSVRWTRNSREEPANTPT